MKRSVILLVVAVLAGPALGHDYWLSPTTHVVPGDQDVGVSLLVGDKLVIEEEFPLEKARTPRIDLFHGTARTDLIPDQLEGARPAFNVPLRGAGGHLLVVDRVPATVELEAAKFEKYLVNEGHTGVSEERAKRGEAAKPGRERYQRNLKALFQVGGDVHDDTFKTDADQTIELIPEQNPTFAETGSTLTFQLTFRDKPLPNHHLVALYVSKDRVAGRGRVSVIHADNYTTDANGRVAIKIDHHADWLIRGVHMTRCEADCDQVEWDSYWFAYAFANPGMAEATSRPPGGFPMIAVIGIAVGAVILAFIALLRFRKSRTSR